MNPAAMRLLASAARFPKSGMTLIEVIVALSILAMSMGGIFAALLQSRRLTEGSVVQNSALTIVQGYIEQLKNMELGDVINGGTIAPDANQVPVFSSASFSIPCGIVINGALNTDDKLKVSTGTPPALSSLTPGVTPTGLGIQDNLKAFDIARDSSATKTTTSSSDDDLGTATYTVNWTAAWPGAQTYTNAVTNNVLSTTTGKTDLRLNLWAWVSDLSGTSTLATKVYGVTLIYTWQYQDGGKTKYIMGTVRTVRSSVPTH